MKVTKKDVEHIARLSRLKLSGEEEESMRGHLEHMLEHFEMLDSVDTSAVPATAHLLPMVNVLRADEPAPDFPREKLLQNAPETDGGCYIVPKVLE